jgi:hypothetical protein
MVHIANGDSDWQVRALSHNGQQTQTSYRLRRCGFLRCWMKLLPFARHAASSSMPLLQTLHSRFHLRDVGIPDLRHCSRQHGFHATRHQRS